MCRGEIQGNQCFSLLFDRPSFDGATGCNALIVGRGTDIEAGLAAEQLGIRLRSRFELNIACGDAHQHCPTGDLEYPSCRQDFHSQGSSRKLRKSERRVDPVVSHGSGAVRPRGIGAKKLMTLAVGVRSAAPRPDTGARMSRRQERLPKTTPPSRSLADRDAINDRISIDVLKPSLALVARPRHRSRPETPIDPQIHHVLQPPPKKARTARARHTARRSQRASAHQRPEAEVQSDPICRPATTGAE